LQLVRHKYIDLLNTK